MSTYHHSFFVNHFKYHPTDQPWYHSFNNKKQFTKKCIILKLGRVPIFLDQHYFHLPTTPKNTPCIYVPTLKEQPWSGHGTTMARTRNIEMVFGLPERLYTVPRHPPIFFNFWGAHFGTIEKYVFLEDRNFIPADKNVFWFTGTVLYGPHAPLIFFFFILVCPFNTV